MQQLSGLDAAFLNLETGPVYGHVSSLGIYDSSTADQPLTAAVLRERMMSRIHKLPMFRRKLVTVPLGLDQPYWCDDDEFDINAHIFDVGISAPGTRQQLNEVVSRLVAKPLDRSRPLWEMAVINGLEDGKTALLATVHHSVIDGGSGNDVNAILLDMAPNADQTNPPPKPWHPEAPPDGMKLLTSAVTTNALRPFKAVKSGLSVTRQLLKQTPTLASMVPSMASRGTSVLGPRTPFNVKPTNRRIFVPFQISLDEVKTIKKAVGATINDVVMAECAGGLRSWLMARGELPDQPLTASIPVSIRDESQKGAMGNQVSMIVTDLPTDVADPLERIKAVHESMKVAKEMHDALPVATIIGFSDFATPAISAAAARAAQRANFTSGVMPNVTISNVPGAQWKMYLCGAELEEFYPVSMIVDGQAMNITLFSYDGHLDFGLVSCPHAVPDLQSLADAIVAEHAALLAEATA